MRRYRFLIAAALGLVLGVAPWILTHKAVPGSNVNTLTRLAERCVHQGDTAICLTDRLDELAVGADINTALGLLQRLGGERDVAASCHTISHELGRRAYARGVDLASTISSSLASCQGAFVHGLLEAAGGATEADGIRALTTRVCVSLGGESRVSCEHGIGHAAYQATGGSTDQAVALCRALRDTAVKNCQDGVFMAGSTDSGAARSLTVSRGCLSLDAQDTTNACLINSFLGVGFEEVEKNGGVGSLLAFCDSVPTGSRVSCYSGLGYASRSLVRTDGNSQENQLGVCGDSVAGDDMTTNTFRSCLWYLIEQNTSLHGAGWFIDLCEIVPAGDKIFCTEQSLRARGRLVAPINS